MPDRPSTARIVAVLTGALVAIAALAAGVALSAGGAAGVTLKRADALALKTLRVKHGTAPVAVFRSRTPLRPGSVIAQAGTPPRPGAARRVGDNVLRRAGVEFSKAPIVMRVGREPAYLYFEDLAPYQAWEHPARIVLVGARTGRVRRSKTIWWPPVVNGRLPSYLRGAAAYAGGTERIFYRGWRLPGAAATRAARPVQAAAADSAATLAAAHELGDQHACAVRVTDVLGSFFTFASINQTRAAMGTLFGSLSKLDPRFQTFRYVSGSGQTPSGFVSRIVDKHGCRDVLIYVTGSGMRDAHEPTVSLGRRVRHDGSVLQSPLTVGDLVHAIRQHKGVQFSVKIDAPYSGGFVNPLAGETNVPLVETATGSGASFAALPEDAGNASRFLEFSNRELAGIERFLGDQAEVQHGIDEVRAGHTPSFLAWMLARGLAISPVPDLAAALGVHFQLKSKFATSGPGGGPQNHAPNAHDVAVTTTAGRPVGVTLAGNDPDGDPLTFTVVTNPSHGTLTGTPPNLTYTPAPAFTGHDSFTFTASDGHLTSNTATARINVTRVAPTVTTTSGATTWTEDGGPVAVDDGLTVADLSSATLTTATARISAGAVTSQDVLAFTPQHGITGSYDVASSTLTLTGSASVADYQDALRSVTYDNSSQDPQGASRTIELRVGDADGVGPAATKALTIVPVDDAPVVTTSSGALAYTENDAATPIDPGLDVTDVDNASLAGATVAITTNYASGEDVLAVPTQNGISGSFNASTGVLTLTGTATVASYRAALRSVTYRNTSDDPSTATRTVSFTANDGTLPSAAATRDVTVAAVDDAPVVTTSSGSAAYTEGGTAATVDPGVTVSDADNANLAGATASIGSPLTGDGLSADTSGTSISASYDSGTGVLTLSGSDTVANYQQVLRTVAFSSTSQDPTAGGTALSRTITFTAGDGTDTSGPATRDVDITAVNQAPVVSASSGTASWTEGDPGTPVDPSISVTDADSANVTGGTVYIASGLLTGDRLSFTDQNGITGSYDAGTGVLTLSGTASVADYQTALQSVTFDSTSDDPTAKDTDGSRSIGFKVTDGTDESTPDFRSVDVFGVNDAPVVTTSSGSAAYTEGGTAATVDPGVTVSDVDNSDLADASVSIGSPVAGDTLAADTSGTSISASYAGGVLTLSGSDTVAHYQQVLRTVAFSSTSDDPTVGDTRTSRTITFVADDGVDLSDPATRDVNVTAVDSAPVVTASAGSTSFVEGTPAAVDPGVTVTDPDNSNLAGATVSITGNFTAGEDVLHFSDQNGIHGSYDDTTGVLTLSGSASVADYQSALRSVTYEDTSDSPATTDRTISFVADDGILTSAPATKTVTVTPVDDAPVVTTTSGTDSYTEQDPAIVVDGGVTVTDVDSATLTGATVIISAGFDTGDSLALPPNGNGISGTWDPVGHDLALSGIASVGAYQDALQSVTFVSTSDNPSTSKTISFVANDGVLGSAPATKGISVTPVNDAPHLTSSGGDINALERTPTTLDSTIGVSDPDDASLQGATVAIASGLQSGEDTLNFTTQNGITGSYSAATGVLTLSGSATLANYQTALRSVTYTDTSHTPNTGTRQISFTVDDGHASDHVSNAITHNLTVTPVNEAPTATTDSYSGAIGNTTFGVGTSPSGPAVTTSGNVLSNDTDPDTPHASLTASAGTTSTHGGNVSMNSDGTFTYLPPAGFTGSDTFTYTVHDNDPGGDLTSTGTVTISVAGPVVWYVNNSGGAGDGRSNAPFNSLGPLTTGGSADSLDGSGDVIFVYQGSGSYGGGIVLEANQQLIGQPQGLTVSGHALVPAGGSNPTITNASGAGITLASGVDVERVNVSTTSGDGITGTNVNTATVGANTSVSNPGGAALKLSGGSGAVTVGANLSSSSARAVDIQNRTGGTTTLNGTVGSGGVFLNGNTGATVALAGTLTLSTSGNDAFTATGGGTVTAIDAGNTITTTTGRAINVANTTIGTGGIKFKSVSTNGAASPINLDTTGSSAGLTITGDGNTTRGGNSSGGTIQNGSGTDGTTGGIGIRLNSTSAVSLNDMHISGFSNFGVSGSSVAGLTLDHSTIDGSNGTNDALDEGSVSLANLTGSGSLSGDVISGGWTNNVLVHNTTGTLNRLTVDNSTIGLNSTSFGNDGIQFTADGAATTANITVSNSSFTGVRGDWLTINPLNSGHTDAVISGNTFTNTHTNTVSAGARIALIPNGTLTYDVNNNTLSGSLGSAIFDNAAGGQANADGKIRNNTIGVVATANSGSSQASGIDVESNGGGDQVVLVDNNKVRQYNNHGILLLAGDSQGGTTVFQATVTNNVVSNPGNINTDFNGIHLNNGIVSTDNFTSCADIRSNTIVGAGQGTISPNDLDFRLRQRQSTTVRLPGYGGASTDNAAVVSFLQGQNNTGGTPSGAASNTSPTGGGFTGGPSACTQP